MTDIIAVSDFHLMYRSPISRKDNIFEAGFKKLKYIIDYANKNDAIIIQAGDLTHTSRNIDVLSKCMSHLDRVKTDFLTIWGQHDQYYRTQSNEATILGILENINCLEVLNNMPNAYKECDIYGCSWGEDIPIPSDTKNINILVIHESITDDLSFAPIKMLNAKNFLKKHKYYNIILCGDIHKKFIVELDGRYILNTGCIVRHKLDDYNLDYKPCFYHININKNKIKIKEVEIPHKNMEEIASIDHIDSLSYLNESVKEFVDMTNNYVIKSKDPKEEIIIYLKENNIEDGVSNIIMGEINNDNQ